LYVYVIRGRCGSDLMMGGGGGGGGENNAYI